MKLAPTPSNDWISTFTAADPPSKVDIIADRIRKRKRDVASSAERRVKPVRVSAVKPAKAAVLRLRYWRERKFIQRGAASSLVAFAKEFGLELFREPVSLDELPPTRKRTEWGTMCRLAAEKGLLRNPGIWCLTETGQLVLDILCTP